MKTFATLFSGGELAGLGIAAAGLEHAWGLEINPAIAEVARANRFAVQTADILKCDPRRYERVDALHASPPCPNFSVAKAGAVETGLDIALAERTADFIRVLQPDVFTLENVYGYRLSRSFGIICAQLDALGYWWLADHLNAASFGVPQTRRRLVLRAVRGRMLPALPAPTPWTGWYQAIEDLIPGLPESRFAPWQLARLPEELGGSFYTVPQQSDDKTGSEFGYGCPRRSPNEPALTVTATQRPAWYKAFIIGGANTSEGQAAPGVGVSEGHDPVRAVNGSNSLSWRAFIMPTVNADGTAHERFDTEPTHTVQSTAYKQMPRAFLFSGGQGDYKDGTQNMTAREEIEPAMTVTAGEYKRPSRAFLVNTREMHGNEGDSPYTAVSGDRPAYTLAATSAPTRHRAWLSAGHVVSMTPRALARFQSVPDTYLLPDKPGLACKIIGNACPPKLMEALYRGLLA